MRASGGFLTAELERRFPIAELLIDKLVDEDRAIGNRLLTSKETAPKGEVMGRGQRIVSTLSLVGLGLPALAGHQKPDSGHYSEPEYETKVVLGLSLIHILRCRRRG